MVRAGWCDGNLQREWAPAELAPILRLPREFGGGCAIARLLQAFIRGALDREHLGQVDTHLGSCHSCQEELLELLPDARPRDDLDTLWSASAVSTFEPGAWVASRYRIRNVLGRGGMGEVYEALDTWFDEPIALKTLVATDCDSSRALDRLVCEARLARRVSHPNVCRTYDVGHHQGGLERGERLTFITMELLRGTPLGEHVRRGPLDVQSVQHIGGEILQGLIALHHQDIIHRDIKCNNVVLCGSSGTQRRVVIVDFGLAVEHGSCRFRSGSGSGRNLEGTMAYMAPEQLAGLPVTPATDVYGFGATLFEMVSGQCPFAASPPGMRHYPSPSASELLRAASFPSERLEAFLQKCLSSDPAARFADAQAALSRFRAIW